MISVRKMIMGGIWMMFAWVFILPAGIAAAQDSEETFYPAGSIASYQFSAEFTKVMDRLSDGRLNPNLVVDWYGHTVMHLVAPASLELLRMAVAKGGDCGVANNFGLTPLHYAAMSWVFGPGPESIRILVACGADVNAQEVRGATPLHAVYLKVGEPTTTPFANFAASFEFPGHGLLSIAQALLESGADPNIKNREGDTPLMQLIRLGNLAESRLTQIRLLADYGADLDATNNEGNTPIFEALLLRQSVRDGPLEPVSVIETLLDVGADPNLRNGDGDTPLIHTAKQEEDWIFDMGALLDGGADPCLPDAAGKIAYEHTAEVSERQLLLYEVGGYRDYETGICARQLAQIQQVEAELGLERQKRKQLQSCLKRQGFDPGAPDGLFGPQTRDSIRGWQSSQGFIGTESAGYLTSGQVETLLEGCRVVLEPSCIDRTEGVGCWKELANRTECYIWSNSHNPARTVTWSGSCDADGIADGRGTAEWRLAGEVSGFTGLLVGGKRQGHTVLNLPHLGQVYEGNSIDGKFDGYRVLRGSLGEEWFCMKDDEQADESACGVVEVNEPKAVKGRAVLRSGPGDEFESLGSVDGGESVTATVRVGDRAWIELSDGKAGFVHASKLADFVGPAVGARFRDCNVCPEMVVVPAGSFMMGSPSSEKIRYDNEGPVHRVTIPQPFAVGRYEVTFDQWDACVSDGGCSHVPDDAGWGRGNRPVINVSWHDAGEYVDWLSDKTGKRYRLLSEAEWEYAARAGTSGLFHFGETISPDRANYMGFYTYGGGSPRVYRARTVSVGKFPGNAFGLHDVHGNVWEWVEDCWHDNYEGAPTDGSAWVSGDYCGSRRVLRGGSWDIDPRDLRSAYRDWFVSGIRINNVGFRVARTLAP